MEMEACNMFYFNLRMEQQPLPLNFHMLQKSDWAKDKGVPELIIIYFYSNSFPSINNFLNYSNSI